MSLQTIILEYVCPALGTLFANLMWMAPIASVREAISIRHSLGVLNPIPWSMMLGNCVGWVAYSFIVKDFWPLIANAPGVVIAVWLNMSAAKLCYYDQLKYSKRTSQIANEDGKNSDEILKIHSLPKHDQIVLIMVVLWSSVLSVITFSPVSTDTQRAIVGIVVNLNLVFFYGGPLSTILTVIKTRNSITIHSRTLAMNTANATFWTLYAIAIKDLYIAIPNGIGVVLGIVQIFLVIVFPRVQIKVEDEIEIKLESGPNTLALTD